MGETRVDLLRLLEDLKDAYPGPIEETIVTEVVANALDSGTRRIALHTDAVAGTCTVTDDGSGMSRAALRRYHDLAVTTKRRGRTIGFAGVGIKLGLLISDEVVTETRTPRAGTPLATSWRLGSRKRAPWRWIEPPGIVASHGTAVRLYLSNSLSPLLDPGFIEATILRHFAPLFHPEILESILAGPYPEGIRFVVNGRAIARPPAVPGQARITVRVGRQRKPSGSGFLVRSPDLTEDESGIEVSTLGKVIKRGWDWLGIPAPHGTPVYGLVEVPALAEVLTLNKADFIRAGKRGATFLAYRKALQEVVSTQLETWGEGTDGKPPPGHRTRALERDLRSVLADLAESYPLLDTLVERRPGGQRRLPLGGDPSARGRTPGAGPDLVIGGAGSGVPVEAEGGGGREGDESADGGQLPAVAPDAPGESSPKDAPPDPAGAAGSGNRHESGLPGAKGRRKRAHYGLAVRFESRPDDPRLGRLVESTVWVNDAHPAHRRAVASRSEGYHVALTVGMALAPLAVEPERIEEFVSEFLARWGAAGTNGRPGRRGG